MGIDAKLDADFDLQIDSNGDILTDDFFDTAILMSIFCERRASASEIPESHRRRGWIGNESTPGFEIGSKLWLYYQARLTRSILYQVETAINDGLQWMIDDNIAVSISVNADLSDGKIVADVTIERPGSLVEHRYYELWNRTGVQ